MNRKPPSIQPTARSIEPSASHAVRQQVQQADAQDHAGDEADRDLHPPVRQPHEQRHPAAEQRRRPRTTRNSRAAARKRCMASIPKRASIVCRARGSQGPRSRQWRLTGRPRPRIVWRTRTRSGFSDKNDFMRACVQRVSQARVTVDGQVCGRIGRGLLVLLGVAADDTPDDARQLADKIVGLRIFDDARRQDEPGAGGRRRRDAGRQPVHAAGRCPQGTPAQLRGRRAAGAGRARCISSSSPRSPRAESKPPRASFAQHMEVSLTNDGPGDACSSTAGGRSERTAAGEPRARWANRRDAQSAIADFRRSAAWRSRYRRSRPTIAWRACRRVGPARAGCQRSGRRRISTASTTMRRT